MNRGPNNQNPALYFHFATTGNYKVYEYWLYYGDNDLENPYGTLDNTDKQNIEFIKQSTNIQQSLNRILKVTDTLELNRPEKAGHIMNRKTKFLTSILNELAKQYL